MCGFVGIASQFPQANRTWLSLGGDMLLHRGPDDYGEWWSKDHKVGLAHRRLSIIELSSAGHQPMHTEDNLITIVLNGEIYNYLDLRNKLTEQGYIFKSNSDTEVVIAAYKIWGSDCLKKFNGMFAFCIYDEIKNLVFLARDRAGEKPLFIYNKNREIRFASELKALLADEQIPRTINHHALYSYLEHGFVPTDECILDGFQKLPPAHAIIYSINTCEIKKWCYWSIPFYDATTNVSKAFDTKELSLELEQLLSDAVRLQLTADVPVGVLLSGGLDSSLITALAAQNSCKIKTFTVSFPSSPQHDESHHARLIANHFNTEHTELVAETNSADLIPMLARQFDEPVADSSMIPTFLLTREIKEYCSVALGGDGGDELFGGYTHYSNLLTMDFIISKIPFFLRKKLSKFSEKHIPLGFLGTNIRTYLMMLSTDFKKHVPQSQNLFDRFSINMLLKNHTNFFNEKYENKKNIEYKSKQFINLDFIQKVTYNDFMNYLPEDILVKVDRASMLNSLEIRAPLLDYRVVEFAFGKIPSNLKISKNEKKIFLKEIAKRILPKEFEFKRKQGFSIPLNSWLIKGKLRDLFWSVLTDESCSFDKSYVLTLLKDQDKGRENSERLFSLALFELWRNEYKINVTLN